VVLFAAKLCGENRVLTVQLEQLLCANLGLAFLFLILERTADSSIFHSLCKWYLDLYCGNHICNCHIAGTY
jgi:hypothetical protein